MLKFVGLQNDPKFLTWKLISITLLKNFRVL